jgi:hypothetical protein
VRGGAWPLLGFGGLLVVMLGLNWIWTGDGIQVALFGFAALIAFGSAGTLIFGGRREAVRRGPPPVAEGPQAIASASLGAVLAGLSVAAIVFGLAFGRFLVYFGSGLLIVSVARVMQELAGQRRARRAWQEHERS